MVRPDGQQLFVGAVARSDLPGATFVDALANVPPKPAGMDAILEFNRGKKESAAAS